MNLISDIFKARNFRKDSELNKTKEQKSKWLSKKKIIKNPLKNIQISASQEHHYRIDRK